MRHVISLGAGVQSSTMALMAARGEITPMPELAIFADTGWEPPAVYTWLNWLEAQLPFPVVRVRRVKGSGSIRTDQINERNMGEGGRWASMPYFTRSEGNLREGRTPRQCTAEYKIEPIERYLRREVMGLAPRQHAPRVPVISQWRGISADEASRMKPSREKWMTVRYPLAMEYRMTRGDCLEWMTRAGYERPPRSACVGCPFHSDNEWREMRDARPLEWLDAIDFDQRIRSSGGMRGDTYLHRSCVPLGDVDLSIPEDHGQLNMFLTDCEGMCGV